MKIDVTTENNRIFQHFGQCPLFTVYDVEDGKIKAKALLDASGSGHSALAGLLSQTDINLVICGGIGAGAINMLGARGIQVISGASGETDAAVRAYLAGQLTDMGSTCNHHDHDHDHACSCHDHCH
jgi:predicted Fe-Mo cluster-binding NifX family protein